MNEDTVLFYDTETTGLPLFNEPSDHPGQPYITELAAQLCVEATGEVLGSMNALIRPEGWEIPLEIQKLTGITMEMASAYGVPMAFALELFVQLWKNASAGRVAHGDPFDTRLIRIALKRDEIFAAEQHRAEDGLLIPFADHWKASPGYCTIVNSTKILNLPPTPKMVAAKRKGPKSPNLAEAYQFFTGRELVGAHRAMNDVEGCKAVYYGIKEHQRKALAEVADQ